MESNIMQVEGLEIIDKGGNVILRIGTGDIEDYNDKRPVISFMDRESREIIRFGLYSDPGPAAGGLAAELYMRSPDGQTDVRIGCDNSFGALSVQDERRRAGVYVDEQGSGLLESTTHRAAAQDTSSPA